MFQILLTEVVGYGSQTIADIMKQQRLILVYQWKFTLPSFGRYW